MGTRLMKEGQEEKVVEVDAFQVVDRRKLIL